MSNHKAAASRPTCCARRRRGAPRQHAAGGVDEGSQVLGVIELKDIVKGGIKERFAELRRMGIKTVMITGDNR
jgi:high-affinity K+ transport system ATPase subunit B